MLDIIARPSTPEVTIHMLTSQSSGPLDLAIQFNTIALSPHNDSSFRERSTQSIMPLVSVPSFPPTPRSASKPLGVLDPSDPQTNARGRHNDIAGSIRSHAPPSKIRKWTRTIARSPICPVLSDVRLICAKIGEVIISLATIKFNSKFKSDASEIWHVKERTSQVCPCLKKIDDIFGTVGV